MDFASLAGLTNLAPGWAYRYQVRQAAFPGLRPLCDSGAGGGNGASCLFPEGRERRSRPYWLFVILAGVVAVLHRRAAPWASLHPIPDFDRDSRP